MYESPITLYDQIPTIMTAFDTQKDNYVCECVARIGVDVNKEELLRALSYDREQYNKGYSDGKVDGTKDFAEWLYRRNYFDGWYKFDGTKEVKLTTDEILAEWQKEVKNGISRANTDS